MAALKAPQETKPPVVALHQVELPAVPPSHHQQLLDFFQPPPPNQVIHASPISQRSQAASVRGAEDGERLVSVQLVQVPQVQPLIVTEAQQLGVVCPAPTDGARGRVAVTGGQQRLLLWPPGQLKNINKAVCGAGRQTVFVSRVETHLCDVIAVRLRIHPEEPTAWFPDVPENQEAVLIIHLLGASTQECVAAAQVEAAVAVQRVTFKHLDRLCPGAADVPPTNRPVSRTRVEEVRGGVGENNPRERPAVAPILSHQVQSVLVVEVDGEVGAGHGQQAARLQGDVQQVGGFFWARPPCDGQTFELLLQTFHYCSAVFVMGPEKKSQIYNYISEDKKLLVTFNL